MATGLSRGGTVHAVAGTQAGAGAAVGRDLGPAGGSGGGARARHERIGLRAKAQRVRGRAVRGLRARLRRPAEV